MDLTTQMVNRCLSNVVRILMLLKTGQLYSASSALTLLVGWQEEYPARKKYGGMVEVGTG